MATFIQAQLAPATTLCMPVQDRGQAGGELLLNACAAFLACEHEHGRPHTTEKAND